MHAPRFRPGPICRRLTGAELISGPELRGSGPAGGGGELVQSVCLEMWSNRCIAGGKRGQASQRSRSCRMTLEKSGNKAGPLPCTLSKKAWKVRCTRESTASGSLGSLAVCRSETKALERQRQVRLRSQGPRSVRRRAAAPSLRSSARAARWSEASSWAPNLSHAKDFLYVAKGHRHIPGEEPFPGAQTLVD
jgi:hypothetical protein